MATQFTSGISTKENRTETENILSELTPGYYRTGSGTYQVSEKGDVLRVDSIGSRNISNEPGAFSVWRDASGNIFTMPAGWKPTGTEVMTEQGGMTLTPEAYAEFQRTGKIPGYESASTVKNQGIYSYGQTWEQMSGGFIQNREPTSEVSLGNEVTPRAVALLGQQMGLSQNDLRIVQTREGSFKLQFFDERSYDPNLVRNLYSLKQEEVRQDIRQDLTRQKFADYTRSKAQEGDFFGNVAYHLSPRFSEADPMGMTTIQTAVSGAMSGKSAEQIGSDIRIINENALKRTGQIYGVDQGRGGLKPYGVVEYILDSPVAGAGMSGVLGYGIGGAINSLNPALAPIVSKIPYSGTVLTWAMEHPKMVEAGGYGIGGFLEYGKIEEMKKMGFNEKDIASIVYSDVISFFSFGEGFKYGLESGLPVKYAVVQVGDETVFRGLTFESGTRGRPLIGRTPEGWTLGTPELSGETIERVYGPSLSSRGGYTPLTPTETRIAFENIAKTYPETEMTLSKGMLNLRSSTFGVQSKYIMKDLPLEEPLTRHGVSNIGIQNVENWIKAQDDIVVYGSVSQKAQMEGFPHRALHDIDLQLGVKDTSLSANELLSILEKTEGKGKFWINPNEPSLIQSKAGHLFDIHGLDIVTSEATSPSIFKQNYIGYGFKGEPELEIGGITTKSLSEQATRKMSSNLAMREEQFFPPSHRIKDIGDYISVEKVLLMSKGGGSAGDVALLSGIEKQWMEKLNAMNIMKDVAPKTENIVYYAKFSKADLPSIGLLDVSPSMSIRDNYINDVLSSFKSLGSGGSLSIPSERLPSGSSKPAMKGKSPSIGLVSLGIKATPGYPRSQAIGNYIVSMGPYINPSIGPSPSPPISPPIESPSPSPSPDFDIDYYPPNPPGGLNLNWNRGKVKDVFSDIGFRRSFKYTPDVGSAIKGISMKLPDLNKVFFGFEIRGINL